MLPFKSVLARFAVTAACAGAMLPGAVHAASIHAVAAHPLRPLACTPANKTAGGLFGTNGGGPTIDFQVRWTVSATCSLSNVDDRVEASSSNPSYYWNQSTVNNQTHSRGCALIGTSWSGWQTLGTPPAGSTYSTQVSSGSNCTPFDTYYSGGGVTLTT